MNDITIVKKNESFVYIDAEPSILMEMSEHFCFFAPGYKFMPAFRNRLWDGKIRLLNAQDQTLPVGLVYQIPEFAKVRGYSIGLKNNSHYGMVGEKEVFGDLTAFIDSLDLTAGDKNIYPYDYQIDAIGLALEDRNRLLLSPTASGKSLIIYVLARYYMANYNKKIVIVVPTTSLVEQMTSDFLDYSQNDRDNFDSESIHKIYSGKEKYNIESDIVITTWQSIYKMPQEWFQQFGMVIGDEAHTFKAKSLNRVMGCLTDAKFRIGMTGTLDGEVVNMLTLEGHFGRVHKVISTKELMEQGAVSKLKISCLLMAHSHEDRLKCKKLSYPEEIELIVTNEKRNKFICNLANELEGTTIILYKLVKKHGEPLFRMMQDITKGTNKKVFFVSGGTAVDQREKIREIANIERGCIIVASLGTFSTGINIKNLHNIIFSTPSKSVIKVLQSVGRILRLSDDGSVSRLYDIIDDLSTNGRQNFALKHGSDRINIYNKEEFDYKVYKVTI